MNDGYQTAETRRKRLSVDIKKTLHEMVEKGYLKSEDLGTFSSALFTIAERYIEHKADKRSDAIRPWDTSLACEKNRQAALKALENAKDAISSVDWLEFQSLENLSLAIELSIAELKVKKKKGRKGDESLPILCSCFMHLLDEYRVLNRGKREVSHPKEVLTLAKSFLAFCGYEARSDDSDRAKLLKTSRDRVNTPFITQSSRRIFTLHFCTQTASYH